MTTTNMTKLTRRKLKSPRLLLILSTLAIFATSAATIVSLILGGYDFIHYIFHSAMLLADITFLILSLFTNYRFRYAIPIPLIYLGVSAGLTAVTVLTDGGTGGTDVFTHFAFYSFIVVHLLAVLTVVFAYMHAAGVGKKPSGMRNTTAIAFLLLVASVSIYSYSTIINGWFGQGAVGVERTLEYTYDESDNTYVVSGVLNGRGDTIVVPAEFNGIRVKSVDCSIFDTPMVTNVYLNCDTETELTNAELIYSEDQPRTVHVKEYQHFGEMFLKRAYSEKNSHYVGLVNQMKPSNIEDNKVYVTFTYNYDDLLAVGGNVLPMWVGDKNTIIDADDFADFDYITHPYDAIDADFSENKLWAYENINKRIFKGVSCFGSAVTESIDHATIEFETLYMVTVDEDNDTLYDIPTDFRYADVTVANSSHIFALSEVDGWIETFDERPGFDYIWKYDDAESTATDFTTLSTVLYDGIVIRPEWTMQAPTITECKIVDNTLIYGETASFLSSAIPAVKDAGFELSYSWSFSGNIKNSSDDWSIDESHPDDTGAYILTVTSSLAGSSLTSTSTQTINLDVAKRPIRVEWTTPDDHTYTGYNHDITLKLLREDMFKPEDREIPTLASTAEACKNASSYTYTAALATLSDRYEITAATKTLTYTINPAPAEAIWDSNTVKDYSGYAQAIGARIERLAGEGELSLTITGLMKNVGEYTAYAASPDSNYYVTEATSSHGYTIQPLVRNVTWINDSFVYDDMDYKPSATFQAVGEDIDELGATLYATVSGQQKNAGTHTATAAIENPNYTVSDETLNKQFTIEPMQVEGTWTNISLVYDGTAQKPVVAAKNKYNKDLTVVVTFDDEVDGNAINAKTYTAYGTPTDTNYALSNNTQGFTITKRVLALTWDISDFVYNGYGQQPYPTIGNGIEGEDITLSYRYYNSSNSLLAEMPKNVVGSTYKLNTYLADTPVNANYEIDATTITAQYEIVPATINATWVDNEVTYNRTNQTCVTATAKGVLDEDVTLTIIQNVQKNAGDYTATVSSANSNYVISTETASRDFSIRPYTVTLTWNVSASYTYNGEGQAPTATTTVLSGDSNLIISIDKTNLVDAGLRTATAVCTDNNYSFSNPTQEFTINPREVDIVWESDSVVYKGSVHAPSAYIQGVGKDATEYENGKIYVNVVGERGTDVGSGYLAEAESTSPNYTIKSSTQNKIYSITKYTVKENEIIWSNLSLTYTGELQAPTAKIVDLANPGEYIDLIITGEQMNANVGTAKHTAGVGTDDPNYQLEISSKEFVINPKKVTVVWDYTTPYTYDGEAHIPGASAIGVSDYDIPLTVTGEKINAGKNYTATASTTDTNYTLLSTTQYFTINPREVEVEWNYDDETPFTYNGTSQAPTASATGINEHSITLSISGAKTNAGDNYTAKATTTDGNYTLTNATRSFSIKKALAIVSNGTTEFTYNGKQQYPNVTATGVGGASVTISIVSGKQTNAGDDYKLTVKSGNSNYKLNEADTEVVIDYVINKATATVTWSNLVLTYNKANQKPTAKIKHLATNANVEIIVTGEQTNANVGGAKYTATATLEGTAYANNYVLSGETTEFEIKPYSVAVAWGETELVYSGYSQSPTHPTYGVGGEYVNITSSIDEGEAIAVGTYHATAYCANSNYTITNNKVTYTIVPKTITLSWSNLAPEYNGQIQTPNAVVFGDGICGDDVVKVNVSGGQKNANVGGTSYTASATLSDTDAANYTISNPTRDFVITPKSVTIEWSNLVFTYDGQLHAPTANVLASDICGSDIINVSVSGAQSRVGTTHIATATIDNANYTIGSGKTHEFTINPKEIEVDWGITEYSITSGMAIDLDFVKLVSGSIVSGDTVSLKLSWTRINQSRTVDATLEGEDAVNYVITNPQQYFDVEIR